MNNSLREGGYKILVYGRYRIANEAIQSIKTIFEYINRNVGNEFQMNFDIAEFFKASKKTRTLVR